MSSPSSRKQSQFRAGKSRSSVVPTDAEVQAFTLSPQEEHAAKELFEAYDLDGTGCITKEELLRLLTEQQWCLDGVVMNEIVSNHCPVNSETIALADFLLIYRAVTAKQPSSVRKSKSSMCLGPSRIDVSDLRELEADQRAAFEAMDTNRSGFLGVDGMKEVLRTSGIPDADGDDYDGVVLEQMELADKNQDGRISFEEFVIYRNAVLDRFLAQSRTDDAQVPDEPSDPWAWQYFAH